VVHDEPAVTRIPAIAVTLLQAEGCPLWLSDLESSDYAEGKVLLIPGSLGPGIVTLLTRCAGVVCKSPALTGHVPILARELGLPCMIGVPDLDKLRKASWIELRPEKGLIIAKIP
jgi:phosphohistidine swiveling domain-containing protein